MDFKEKLLDSHLAFEQDVDLLHPIHKYRKNALKRFEKDGFPNKSDELLDIIIIF
jgi:Fe-S cluster assembly protein SufD